MSDKIVFGRKPRGLGTPNVRDKYPTPQAPPRQLKKMSRVQPKNAEDGYPRQIRCAQCGFPIADHQAIQRCPHCDSDNFLGRYLGKIRQ